MAIVDAIVQYIKDSRTELKKVVWPSRREVVQHTMLVIAISLGVAAFLGAVDFLLNMVLETFLL